MERPITMGRGTEQPMAMKWQDWVTLVLGVWLFFSPWILGFYSSMPGASWNFFLLGIAFVVFSAFGLSLRTMWEEWVTLVLGLWMIVSPWVLAYSTITPARDDAVIVGVINAALAIWTLAERRAGVAVHDHGVAH
jgi:hypothetical protein